MTWEDIFSCCRAIAEQVKKRYGRPDVVVGILRSGAVPAAIISMLLEVDEVHMIRVVHYDDSMPPKEITREPKISRFENVKAYVKGRTVLVVDDLVRSGKTLRSIVTEIKKAGARKVISACIVLRESDEKPVMLPDIYVVRTAQCLRFPWTRTKA